MTAPGNALQKALFDRLTAQLTTTPIYDYVPQGTNPPYVLVGDDTLIQWDTKSRNGWECTVTIHAWDTEKAGRKSVKTILAAIYDALHNQSITVTGFTLVQIQFEFEQTFQDPTIQGSPDKCYHGVQRYRATIHA